MKAVWAFITQMDRDARRSLFVLSCMLALVVVILLLGRDALSLPESEFHKFFMAIQESGWGLLFVILTFVCAAFLGAPQWALIAGVVLAFGPWTGSLYAWIATMISASFDFWLGRWMGAERLRRYGGSVVNRILGVVRQNGFVTSFAIRFVPTGPFVLVNMAAGVSRMTFAAFIGGTALGIIPKIAVVGLVARGLVSGQESQFYFAGFIGLAALVVLAMIAARRILQAKLSKIKKNSSESDENS